MEKPKGSRATLSRRRFLARAGVAAPLILTLRGEGGGAASPGNHIRLAAIGCGSRAQVVLLQDFARQPDARIVAVCDSFAERRLKMAADLNAIYGSAVCQPVADFREVITRADIDALIVCTPDHWHMPIAFAGARAGKDLYVEKPLGPAWRQALRVRAEVEQRGVVFQYGTQQRTTWPQFRRACEFVRNGYIGKVREVICWCPDMAQSLTTSSRPYGTTERSAAPEGFDYDEWLGPAPEKPYSVDRCTRQGAYHIYDYSLGHLAVWGAHPLDFAQWALDLDATSPVRYEGRGVLPPPRSLYDTLEAFDVRCEYANGIRLSLSSLRVAAPRLDRAGIRYHEEGVRLVGENGWIQVDRTALMASDRRLQERNAEVKEGELRMPRPSSHGRNFLDCVRDRSRPMSNLQAAVRSDTISHLANIAMRLERPIRWDPEKERVLDDPEAEAMLDRPVRPAWDLFAAS